MVDVVKNVSRTQHCLLSLSRCRTCRIFLARAELLLVARAEFS